MMLRLTMMLNESTSALDAGGRSILEIAAVGWAVGLEARPVLELDLNLRNVLLSYYQNELEIAADVVVQLQPQLYPWPNSSCFPIQHFSLLAADVTPLEMGHGDLF